MARKKNTDAEETRSALQKVKDDAFAKGVASEAKAHAKTAKKLEKITAAYVKLVNQAESSKKEISDLKNFLKAKYKDGYQDGFNKGYNTGTSDAIRPSSPL